MISIIAAMDRNGLIGADNQLPWHLPSDMKHFIKKTKYKTVVMGRKTFESIGKPLPYRRNIVLTHDGSFMSDECEVVHSLDDVLKFEGEVFVIGGATLYEQMLPNADRLYLTVIDGEFEGDAFFPELELDKWNLVSQCNVKSDDENRYDHTFYIYERV